MLTSRLIRQFLYFGIVGGIATVVDFGVLALLTETGLMGPVWAAAISFTASVLVNYALSMRFVFTHREDMARSVEIAAFILLSVIGLGINEVIMWLGVEVLHVHYLIDKVVATAVVLLWNFGSRKLWLDGERQTRRAQKAKEV